MIVISTCHRKICGRCLFIKWIEVCRYIKQYIEIIKGVIKRKEDGHELERLHKVSKN